MRSCPVTRFSSFHLQPDEYTHSFTPCTVGQDCAPWSFSLMIPSWQISGSICCCMSGRSRCRWISGRARSYRILWLGAGTAANPADPTSELRSTGDSDCLGVLLNAALGVQVPAALAANSGEKYEKTLVLDSHFLQWRHPGDRALIHHPVVVLTGLYSFLFSFLDQAICSVSKFPSYLAIGGTQYFPIQTPAAHLNLNRMFRYTVLGVTE